VEAADRFIEPVYLPAHNARFAVTPAQEGTAFVAVSGVDLAAIPCVREERRVGQDNTVAFHRSRHQIPASPRRPRYVKATLEVRQHLDGSHAIFHGPRCIGRYHKDGIIKSD